MFYTFYEIQNSFVGRIDLSYSSNGCAISMTPVYKPVSPKDIKAGMKIYNYDKTVYFTLTIKESMILINILDYYFSNGNLPEDGQVDNGVEISTYEGRRSISFKHFINNKPTIFSITFDKDSIYVGYSANNTRIGMQIDYYDLQIIREWLKHLFVFRTNIIASNKFNGYQKRNNNSYDNSYNNYNSNRYNDKQNNMPGIAGIYNSKDAYQQPNQKQNYMQKPEVPNPPPPITPVENSVPSQPSNPNANDNQTPPANNNKVNMFRPKKIKD